MGDYWLLSAVLGAIFVVGTLLCLPFYQWNLSLFVRSQLFIKCVMWLPIYVIFLIMVLSPPMVGCIICICILLVGLREFLRQTRHTSSRAARAYMALFSLAVLTLCLFVAIAPVFAPLVLAVGVSSALSDVFAFFGGKFLGKHMLPNWINHHKSWEGVAGQLVGGAVGAIIVALTYDPTVTVFFGLVVGIGSALGDIANSIAKRSLAIKDWGASIPGHGGFLDRFSSLMCAYLLVIALHMLHLLPVF